MHINKKLFLIISIFLILFPLTAGAAYNYENPLIDLQIKPAFDNNNSYIQPVFFSRKKAEDSDEKKLKRQKELMEKRAKAEAEIAARKEAQLDDAEFTEEDEAAVEESENPEASITEVETETAAPEVTAVEETAQEEEDAAALEAQRKEEERLKAEKLEAERLEAERLEAERIEKEKQEKLQKEMELELEKQKAAASVKRKEYLSDYIVYDIDTPDDSVSEEDTYYRIENPDERDAGGRTLLMRAAKSGNEWELRQLLSSGADVNLKDNDGWTALMYAVRYSEGLECVQELLEAGAQITVKNNYGSSALALAACYNGNPQILTKLLEHYKSSDKEVLRALVFLLSEQNISERQQLTKLQIFMDKAVPLNVLYEGKTPLMYAAQYGNSTKVIQLLLDNQAAVTLKSTEGKTAFDYANNNKNLTHDESFWALNKR